MQKHSKNIAISIKRCQQKYRPIFKIIIYGDRFNQRLTEIQLQLFSFY